ncbi:hypothetical protein [Desulfocurvus sp. DL9XJH121]
MAAIEFQGLDREPTGSTSTVNPALERSALLSRVSWRFENAQSQSRYARLGDLVLETLDRRVGALADAAARFSWPVASSSVTEGARQVDAHGADVKGLLRAELRSGQSAQRYYKYFSRGRSADADSGLAAGDYTFTLSQGGETEDIDVSIPTNATWGQALELTARAINASALPVQAEVVRQTAPGQRLDFLSKTGSVLAVTLNPAHADQDVELADTDGLLLHGLDLTPASAPLTAAGTGRHTVQRSSRASASTFVSDLLNPVGAVDLEPGDHRLLLDVGGESVEVEVAVDADMDWETLLTSLALNISAADERVTARVVQGEADSGLLYPATQRAVALELTLDAPKLGQRLSVREYGGPWLADVDGMHDPSSGLPNWVDGGERYLATATANGWTEGNVYEYDGSAWTETQTGDAAAVYNADEGADYFLDGGAWSQTPSGTLARALGLNATSAPGADATALVDGREMVSETGVFSLEQGRLAVEVTASSGEALPLSVTQGYALAREQFLDLADAYNGLQNFLQSNADILQPAFVRSWSAPVLDLSGELDWLGVSRLDTSGNLWVRRDEFAQALVQDPARARAALYDAPGGLAPRLAALAEASTGQALRSSLAAPQLPPLPSPARDVGLAKLDALQQVVAAATDAPRPEQSPYTLFSNLISSASQGEDGYTPIPGDSGRILDFDS